MAAVDIRWQYPSDLNLQHPGSICNLKQRFPLSLNSRLFHSTEDITILFFCDVRSLFVSFQLLDTFSTSIALQLNAKSQRWEVLSLFTIQGNSQFAGANINNRHRGREMSAYKIWIQGSAIMRSAFVHCVGKISPPNNSFIHPYRFLKCSVLPSHHSPATQQQARGLNFHSCIIFDSPCKVCSPVSR